MFANAATKKADASKKQESKAETNGTTTAGKADKKNQKVTHVTYLLCTLCALFLLIIKKKFEAITVVAYIIHVCLNI